MFARLLLAVANFFLVVSATRNFLLPNSLTPQKFFRGPWADEVKQSLRVSSDVVPSVESKYGAQSLVYVQYSTKTDCSGEKGISSGITFNVCMTGYDRDGNILGSGMYATKAESPNYIQASYTEYSTADCTGEATYEEKMTYPKNCMPGTETGSGKFSLADTTDVSTILKDGILYSYYDTKSHCGAEVASTWTWVPYNHCMTSDDGFTHFALTGCSNGSYSACTYADAACQTVTICSAVDLLSCYWYTEGPSTGNNGYYYNSYLTQHCI